MPGFDLSALVLFLAGLIEWYVAPFVSIKILYIWENISTNTAHILLRATILCEIKTYMKGNISIDTNGANI